MANEIQSIIELRHTEQTRYTYFLLTAAASAVALAVSQTQNATFDGRMVILACAVASWLYSFLSGAQFLRSRFPVLAVNAEILKVQKAVGGYQGASDQERGETHSQLRETFQELTSKSAKYGAAQFRALIAGALFYLTWHVVGIAVRTAAA